MNYLIDVDVALLRDLNMDRKYFSWFLEWSRSHSYYLITSLNFDALYESVGKEIIYNAQVVYTENGKKTYIQSQMVEHDDAVAKDSTTVLYILPEPLTYYGDNIAFGHAVTGNGDHFCRVRNWKEAWKHLKEEELCA
jgi:hypothetical protein